MFEELASSLTLDASEFVDEADAAAEASEEVAASTDEMSESLFDVDAGGVAAGGAMLGVGTAAQGVLDDTQSLRESLGRTAVSMDMSSDEANELARGLSDATFPIEDATATMDSLAQQGIDTADEMEEVAGAADNIADATGTSAESVAQNLGPAIQGLGHDLEELPELQDAFTVAVRETALETDDLAQVIERSSEELTDLGLDAEESTALIAAYADETGKSGRRASRDFAQAVREADGDMEALKEETGLSEETIGEYTEQIQNADGATEEYADAANDSLTTMDSLRAGFDDAMLSLGGLLGPLDAVAPAMQTAGIAAMAMSAINFGAVIPSITGVGAALWGSGIAPAILAIAAAAGVLYKAWDSNFLGIQNVTQDVLSALVDGFGWLTDKISGAVDWVIEKVTAIPDVLGSVIDAIPGIDSEDILGDVDLDGITDSLFPPKPGEEGEEVGEEVAEGMTIGVEESDEELPVAPGAASGDPAEATSGTEGEIAVATDSSTETPDLPERSSTGSSTMDRVVEEIRNLRDALEGLGVRIETGDETLDRVIEEHAELVVDEEMTRQHKQIRHS